MIRIFCEEDLEQVMQLWFEGNCSAHDFIDKQYWIEQYHVVKQVIPKADIVVYEEENIIKGFIGMQGAYIAGLFVQHKFRRQGIGKRLVQWAKEGGEQLSLHVYKKNDNAIEFYHTLGFEMCDQQLDDKTGELEIQMTWAKEEVS